MRDFSRRLSATFLALCLPALGWAQGGGRALSELKAVAADAGSAPLAFEGSRQRAADEGAPSVKSDPIVIHDDLHIGPASDPSRKISEPPGPKKETAQERAEREKAEDWGAVKGGLIGAVFGGATGAILTWSLWSLLGPVGAILIGAAAVAGGILIGRDVGKHCGGDPQCS